jgi:hypothetical protein
MPISGWIWIFSSRIIAGYFKEMKIQEREKQHEGSRSE